MSTSKPLSVPALRDGWRHRGDRGGARAAGPRSWHRLAALAILLVPASWPWAAPPPSHAEASYAERMHARALASFRQGRFPEAYGRFIDLANAGHVASARYALWMCEQGSALFGKDWDCTPHEADAWARAIGAPPPRVGVRLYPAPTGSSVASRP